MARLPLLMGLFLSVTVSGVVFLLSLVAKVTLKALLYRFFVSFFVFGMVGILFGFLLELFLVPGTTEKEREKLKDEMELDNKNIKEELGDLLKKKEEPEEPGNDLRPPPPQLKPIIVPRMSKENGNVVSRGDSAVVS